MQATMFVENPQEKKLVWNAPCQLTGVSDNFVEEAILSWGTQINKEAEVVQISSKITDCIPGPMLATGAQQEVPNSPVSKKLKL